MTHQTITGEVLTRGHLEVIHTWDQRTLLLLHVPGRTSPYLELTPKERRWLIQALAAIDHKPHDTHSVQPAQPKLLEANS